MLLKAIGYTGDFAQFGELPEQIQLVLPASGEKSALAMTAPHPSDTAAATPEAFDPYSTMAFQRHMERAPEWFCSLSLIHI